MMTSLLTFIRQASVTICCGSTTSTSGSFKATSLMELMLKPYTLSHPACVCVCECVMGECVMDGCVMGECVMGECVMDGCVMGRCVMGGCVCICLQCIFSSLYFLSSMAVT